MSGDWTYHHDTLDTDLTAVRRLIEEYRKLSSSGDSSAASTKSGVCRKKLQLVGAGIGKLESELRRAADASLFTDKEVLRRQDLLSDLKTRHEKCLTVFKSVEMDRGALLGGDSGGSGHAWGRSGNADSSALDSRGLLEQQNQIMFKQDEGLDLLSASIARQKQLGMAIGNELEDQEGLLDDLDSQVDKTHSLLKRETKHVMEVSEKVKTGGMCCCIFLLLVAMIVLLAV
mmetsp:Transcript_99464/g.309899  ORF Transcript_99464/g.309899 Transcript_99464/m.309899 type:complete len:230 (-) Transcript_99464:41-730(-)